MSNHRSKRTRVWSQQCIVVGPNMKVLQGCLFGTRVPFKQTLEVNLCRIFANKTDWFLSGKRDDLRAFGYERSYPDSEHIFRGTNLSGKLDLLQLCALVTGVILLSRAEGGELLNVAAIVSLFEAVSFTGDKLRHITSTLDRAERLFYRGMVGKEYATEVVHDSELAMTFSVLWNFVLATVACIFPYLVVRDVMVRAYHLSLIFFYALAYVEKIFNYKLAGVISIVIETQVFSGRISNQTAIAMLAAGAAIRVVKFISTLAGNNLYAGISSAACIFDTTIARKVLNGIPASDEEVCSRIYFARIKQCGDVAKDLESAIVTQLSFNDDVAHLSHEIVSEFDDPEESVMSATVHVTEVVSTFGTYNTSAIAVPRNILDVR